MAHLRGISRVIFLEVRYEEITRRIRDVETRGIAKSLEQTFKDLYEERQALYQTYAETTIDSNDLDQEELAAQIVRSLHPT